MKAVFASRLSCLLLLLVYMTGGFTTHGQTFNFVTRDENKLMTAKELKAHAGADTIVVRQGKWDEMIASSSWYDNLKFKSVHAFVRFSVNHSYPVKMPNPYTFRLTYKIYGYSNMADTNAYTTVMDTLTISYKPDSLASFQDMQYKKYSNFHKIMIVIGDMYEITSAGAVPVLVDMSPTGPFNRFNFNVEGAILVQPYNKKAKNGSAYTDVYGGSPPFVMQSTAPVNDYLPVRWNLSGNSITGSLALTPANYELEWAYVDNYKVSNTGVITEIANTQLNYNFKDNSTRVWLDTNYYQIPMIYQKGYIVYRVRLVRPDSIAYQYPIYSNWTIAESGTVSSAGAANYRQVTSAHLNDSLNWQYTVSFAEQGKYKQVLSYYDGMLKNRQSITRFNSLPQKLIATEQVYDFEGRPSISVLPTPISSPSFRYQYNLTLNSFSGLPYKAADFDKFSLSVCPTDKVPDALSTLSPARIYYSPANPDQTGFQQFVPDAGGYPFVQTVYSPGYDERVEKQGGAGDSLQLGYKHTVKNDYVSSDQMDLNRQFGLDIGWSGFYRKTVSRDPNGQLSMNVTDYKGKTVSSSMIGIPDTTVQALVANENLADTASYMEDHIMGTPQQVMGNKRILDKNFFNDAGGNNLSWYVYNFTPFPTFCPGKYLSVKARFDYSIFDECGTLVVDTGGTLGTTGVMTSASIIPYTSPQIPFYMDKGKHSLHKELTLNTDEVDKAVDDFMVMDAAQNCMKTERWFIKESVLSKQFPCPENYVNWDCNTCAGKKYELMQELWPNKDSVYAERKYGVYDKNTSTVLGNNNSILTLLCGSGPNPDNWNTIITDGSIRTVINVDGSTHTYENNGNYVLGAGNFGAGLNFSGFVLNGNDTLHCKYRYQDTCLVHLPNSITRFGRTYTNLQSLPVDTFIYIFNDTIAEALLPLHPEFCSLLDCVDDLFAKKMNSIPDAKVASALTLMKLSDIIAADPLYTQMLSMPAAYPNAYDTLAYSVQGIFSLDTMAFMQAYCNCQDSIMFAECYNNMFHPEIISGLLANDYVKQRYFEMVRRLYLGNRKRYLFNLNPAASALGNCATCQDVRMTLVPLPVFMEGSNPDGSIATGISSMLGTISVISPSSVASVTAMYNFITQVNVVPLDTLQLDPAAIAELSDSASTLYNNTSLSLCMGPVDQIIQQLVNCADSLTLNKVRDSLMYMCTHGQVATGGYTPDQIRYALTSNGIAIGDICNPYLVNYDGNMALPAGNTQGAFACNSDAFYADATTTFSGTPLQALKSPGTSLSLTLGTTNQFHLALRAALNNAASCTVLAAYNSSLKLYTLTFTAGTKKVKAFFKSGTDGLCANAFAPSGSNDTVKVTIGCATQIPGGFANGYVGLYSFSAAVSHKIGTVTTTCTLPAWTDTVKMNNEGENPLRDCVPCTQMRNLYKDFTDTLTVDSVKGIDHPYYRTMLRNFMNYRLKKAYADYQYLDFIESCALADSMPIKRYIAYANILFSTSADAANFLTAINNIDPTVTIVPLYRVFNNPTERLYLDFNLIPISKLRVYKNFVTNYVTGVVSPPSGGNKAVNQPIITTVTDMGRLLVPVAAAFTPNTTTIFGSAPGAFTFSNGTNNYNVAVGSNAATSLYKLYIVSAPAGATNADISLNSRILQEYLFNNDIPGLFLNTRASTINDQYNVAEQKAYLNYTYGYQNLPANKVLDSLQTQFLQTKITLLNGKTLSYGHPAQPGTIQNLYIGNPATATAGTDYAKLDTILTRVKNYFFANTGKKTIFFNGSNTRNILPNNQLTAYRCGDTAFYYRYFGNNDSLFDIFVRVPAYLDTAQLPKYELQSFTYNLGEGSSMSFRMNLTNALLPALPLNINGFTDFVVARNTVLRDVLLAHPVNAPYPIADTVNNCERQLLNTAIYEGKLKYKMYVDSIRERLTSDFWAYLMSGGIQEQLFVGYKNQRFNYTLYYYDRAGNLMRTVPPAGVSPLSVATATNVDAQRTANSNSSSYLPAHLKESDYKYNSLNQVFDQNTPDGGTTLYFYDAAGRAIFSQNAKQRLTGGMTYTLYDKQGRIMETGQAKLACTPYFDPYPSMDVPTGEDCAYYNAEEGLKTPFPPVVHRLKYITHDEVVAYVRSLTREEVVLTHYDQQAIALSNGMAPQENLRKRVAAIKYFDFLQPSDVGFANYDYAMHFSYDIAGNVKTLTRDYPAYALSGQQFKRVDYDYDVISGKVNLLSYNRSFADQFFQRYQYDDDNRITKVETSNDGYIWKRDAEYQYYQHGPLARMSLGDLRVQGVDYAYTIQGWLKAVNGDLMDTLNDMGKDAAGNSIHAKDAVALTLDYFKGDYKPIGTMAVTHIADPAKSLYNGNIPRATTSIAPFPSLNTNYVYDQLNRIIKAQYAYVNPYNGNLSNTADYYSKYAYDPDGNLKKLVRNGNAIGANTQLMDSLEYHYQPGQVNNRLQNITDYVANASFVNDIKNYTNPASSRYLYDATGNTIKDLVSGQDTILWSHYNKVMQTRNDSIGNGLHFEYDGAGNRFLKSIVATVGDTTLEKSDYYVRDAQGNILAIYKSESRYEMTKRQWVEYVTSQFLVQVTRRTYLESLVTPYFAQVGQFKNSLVSKANANTTFRSALLLSQPVSFYVRTNKAVKSNMLAGSTDYPNLYSSMATYTTNTGKYLLADAAIAAMQAGDFRLGDMIGAAFQVSDSVMKDRVYGLLCLNDTLAKKVLDSLYHPVAPTNCTQLRKSLYTYTAANPKSFFTNFQRLGQQAPYQNSYFTFVRNFTTNTPINQFAAFTGSNGVLIPYYQPSLDGYANDSLLGAFMDTWSPARTLLNGTTGAQVQLNVVYDNATVPFLEQYIDNVDGGNLKSVYDGLAAIPSLTLPYYLRRWELVTNTTAIVRTIYENVLKGRSLYLSAHHLYGSSRLGTKDYLPGQYRMDWDYTGPTVIADTAGLMARRPWYSLEYNDNISGLALQPYSMADMSAYLLSHQIGQKQYELTNHLGNVQATISDYPSLLKVGEGDTIRQRNPALVTAYDYYPFGMLMPGRGTDSILGISNVNGNILIESNDFSDGTLQGWTSYGSAAISNASGRLKVNIQAAFRGADKDFSVIPGRQYRVRLRVDRGTVTVPFSVKLVKTSPWTTLQTQTITQPITDVSFNFTPTTNMVTVMGESSTTPAGTNQDIYFDNFVLEEIKQQAPVAPVVNGGCITMTQTKWVTTYEDYCYDVYNWVWPFYQVVNGALASVLAGASDVQIQAANASANVSFQFDVLPNVPQELNANITSVTTGGGVLQVSELVNGSWVTLNQKGITAKGSISMSFTPNTTKIKVVYAGPLLIKVGTVCIKKPVLKQENILVDICPDADDKYRFGFNGQEKVNEWAGIGNHLDFGERGYDSRAARFPTLDQLRFNFPGYSPYIFAMNRPIDGYDYQGMRWENFNPKNVGVVVFGSAYIDGDARSKRLPDAVIKASYESAIKAGQNVIVAANWEELLADLEEKGKPFKNLYFGGHGSASGDALTMFGWSSNTDEFMKHAEAIKGVGSYLQNVILLGCFEGLPDQQTGGTKGREDVSKSYARTMFSTLINKPIYSNKGYGEFRKMFNGGYQTFFGHAKDEPKWIDNLNTKNRGWHLDNPDGTSRELTTLSVQKDGNFTTIDWQAIKASLKKGTQGISEYFRNNLSPASGGNDSKRAKDNWNLSTK